MLPPSRARLSKLLDAAVWQMMRGAIVIFSAIFTVTFLKRKLLPYKWVSVAITTAGLVCVGTAAMLDEKKKDSQGGGSAGLGITLVLCAQVMSAFQMCFEEKLLTGQNVSAKKTVGYEGFWGIVLMGVILALLNVAPGNDYGGVFENVADSQVMLTSPEIQFLCGSFMLSIAFYNWFGLTVSKKLSAVTRCLIDTCRTLVVWLVQLALWKYGSDYGESLKPHSWLQLIGFVLVIIGTLCYNAVIKLPRLEYEDLMAPDPPQLMPMLEQKKNWRKKNAFRQKYLLNFLIST